MDQKKKKKEFKNRPTHILSTDRQQICEVSSTEKVVFSTNVAGTKGLVIKLLITALGGLWETLWHRVLQVSLKGA